MIGLFIGAGVLGLIIAVMEGDGEFPGWLKMAFCVLAAAIPAALVNSQLPRAAFPVGLAVGAVCAGFVISFTCGMSVKRASIAAGIYLGITVALELAIYGLA